MASTVAEGSPAPGFRLPSTEGREISLDDYRGRTVALYFYVRDDTPGCTRQACGLRDAWRALERRGVAVLGISPDDPSSHARFKGKYALPFPLLSDAGAQVAKAYGVWAKKRLYGREFWGVKRTTFLIGPDGRILKVIPRVDVDHHAQEILDALGGADAGGDAPGPRAGRRKRPARPMHNP